MLPGQVIKCPKLAHRRRLPRSSAKAPSLWHHESDQLYLHWVTLPSIIGKVIYAIH